MPRTFDALLTIIRFYLRTAVALIVLWLLAATFAGYVGWGWPIILLGFGWLLAPFVVVAAIPITSLGSAGAARDPQARTWVEGPQALLRGMWAIGLVYAFVLYVFDWSSLPTALFIFLISIFAIAAIQSTQLFGSWSARVSGIFGLVILGCLLMTLKGSDLVGAGKPLTVVKSNWLPAPNDVHETGKDIGEWVEEAQVGATKAENQRIVRAAGENVENVFDRADRDNLVKWSRAVQVAVAGGKEPPPMPTPVPRSTAHSSVTPGWLVSHDGRFKLNVTENEEWLKATTRAVNGKVVHIDWRRDANWLTYWYEDLSVPVGKPGREGRGVKCSIVWDATKGAWVGNDPDEDGAFIIYPK